MAYVKIGAKYYELASRMSRFSEFFVFLVSYLVAAVLTFIISIIATILLMLAGLILFIPIGIIGLIFQTPLLENLEDLLNSPVVAIIVACIIVLMFVFLGESMRRGFSAGTKQVIRLKDGKPCGFKEKIIRLLTLLLQPLDIFWMFWKDRQRLGDRVTGTVVVKADLSETPDMDNGSETQYAQKSSTGNIKRAYKSVAKDMFAVWRKRNWRERMRKTVKNTESLERTIQEMNHRLSITQQKLNAASNVEGQFRMTYQKIIDSGEQCYRDATHALRIGNEETARKILEKRNESRRLARQCKMHAEEQKQVIEAFTNLQEYMQQKIKQVEAKKAGIDAQHINVATAAELRQTLQKLKDNPLIKMEQDADAATILAKVEAETDTEYQDAEFERKYDDYTKNESIEDELNELKRKLQ